MIPNLKCVWCGKALDEEDAVWVDPDTGDATTGDAGKPYHVACAPAQALDTGPETCESCHASVSGNFHSCPYAEEIAGIVDSSYCNCCDVCRQECEDANTEDDKRRYRWVDPPTI